jgi:hypothetical protein
MGKSFIDVEVEESQIISPITFAPNKSESYIQGWPNQPQKIHLSFNKIILRCIGDIIIVLLAICFFIFAILVRVYDGSERNSRMTNALETSARFVCKVEEY